MGAPRTDSLSEAGAARASAGAEGVRLCVEQASYAYWAGRNEAPPFALAPISFQVRPCELAAIVGPNASGKSTLLRLLAGTLAPLSGRVQLDGHEVSRLPARLRAQRIAMVAQESALLFPLRVWEYVLQGRRPYGRWLGFETPEDWAIAEDALAQVAASPLRDRWMGELSGGEKQRVVLARALAQRPWLLLLDEPTLHLDLGAQASLLRRLRRLARTNRYAVVVVTHELNLASAFADQIVLLQRGKCLRVGTPGEVFERELLEQVFGAPLEIEVTPAGRPRVHLRAEP
ncbi:MAG: ABC transporter ATP-binding protein [Firmicutes bacterium]|nr:ABC transporter ATP-binding protein [Bacillota bacterium]